MVALRQAHDAQARFSGIGATEGKKIYEFLTYDSSVRKKAMVEEKLGKASPEEKKDAGTKIKEVHDKYDK